MMQVTSITCLHLEVFQVIPQNGCFTLDKSTVKYGKIDDLGVPPFSETRMYVCMITVAHIKKLIEYM